MHVLLAYDLRDESSCVVDPQQSMLDEDPSSERQCKGRLRKQYKLDNRRARQAADDKTFKNCIGRIDTAFNNELSLLVDVLICRSQQEPYLADLVQALKAVERAASHPSPSLFVIPCSTIRANKYLIVYCQGITVVSAGVGLFGGYLKLLLRTSLSLYLVVVG